MKLFRLLLLPLSWLYDLLMRCRNQCYDKKKYLIYHPKIPTIGVGNLIVGGTGKTPMVGYLTEFFGKALKKYNIYIVSRGYGRNKKGMIWANEKYANPNTLGEEAYLLYKKYSNTYNFNLIVHKNRVEAIKKIEKHNPISSGIIILDDAFQHRSVVSQCNILLTDYYRLFTQDFVLPFGRLRESRYGVQRADIVMVTKCPVDISDNKKEKIKKDILAYCKTPYPKIFFSKLIYTSPQKITLGYDFYKNIVLVTGIAFPLPLIEYCKNKYNLLAHLQFSDHHQYTKKDLEKIKWHFFQFSQKKKCILTTEKDGAWLLHNPHFSTILGKIPIFQLAIDVRLLNDVDNDDFFNTIAKCIAIPLS